jgi:hypothetical protein
MTFAIWQANFRVVDHPEAHEATTMMLPLLLLMAAITLRFMDMSIADNQTLGGEASSCPVVTDYGQPAFGLLALFGVPVVLVIMVFLTNLWAKRRSRASAGASPEKPFYFGVWFMTLWAVLLYAVLALLLILNHISTCQEAGWFNGHTWWHILTASALYLQWRYYDHHTANTTGKSVL